MPQTLTPELHRQQIEAYIQELPSYKVYAKALKRVFENACKRSVSDAIVQAREKTVSSFAEKCVRRFNKQPDAVRQFTDLCGARIIVQTMEQVRAVMQFIEGNFEIVERDDKASLLGEDRFGYRDMHYLVRLKAARAEIIGFTADESSTIGRRISEVQVRSLVQHAWASIVHDRVYKAPLKLSGEVRRTTALLGAIMEDGDRLFERLADELDTMAANYTAYASDENVEKEIAIQNLLLENASDKERPLLALKVARLIAGKGKWAALISLLEPYQHTEGPHGRMLLLELGHAFCRLNRSAPRTQPYRHGQEMLEQVIAGCEAPDLDSVPDLYRNRGIHARALARLGWSLEPLESEAYRARDCYRRAVEREPSNPYYLTDMLGFELKFAAGADLVAGFRSSIRSALAVCRKHAVEGTELPAAFFTAARLGMLLGDHHAALNDYSCGIRHLLSDNSEFVENAVEDEIAWLHRAHAGRALPEEFSWAEDLLHLAQSARAFQKAALPAASSPRKITLPVLLIAGSAASLKDEDQAPVENLLRDALAVFQGTVISGGTTSGVPGCVGSVAAQLRDLEEKGFRLIGYIPEALPHDAEKDKRYDEFIVCGSDKFTPAQVLRCWKDLFDAGIPPAEISLIGFAGGSISAFEYRLALALGSTVGLVCGSGGAVDELSEDPLWAPLSTLIPLPRDAKSVRAFLIREGVAFSETELDAMAQEFHSRYREGNTRKIKPDNLKPWQYLPETYRTANRNQAAYAVGILEAANFGVRKADGPPVIFSGFTNAEIEFMAELEHGRWNVDRLRDGWRPGPRDDERKLHDCIVTWQELPDAIREYDRFGVRAFPEILAKAGLEVFRKPPQGAPVPRLPE